MPYIGNYHVTGDTSSNFRLLDDISSFTQTFDPSASGVIDTANHRIKIVEHRFVTGQRVTYGNGGASDIGGLSAGVYFIIKHDRDHIRLATSSTNAFNDVAVLLTGTGGVRHIHSMLRLMELTKSSDLQEMVESFVEFLTSTVTDFC